MKRFVVASLLALCIDGCSSGSDYMSELQERRADRRQYDTRSLSPQFGNDMNKVKEYIDRLHHLEKRFSDNDLALRDFIRQNEEEIYALARGKYEAAGKLTETGGKFSIIPRNQDNIKYSSYIDELLAGNFTHKGELDLYLTLEPHGADNGAYKTSVRVLEEIQRYNSIPEEKRKALPARTQKNMHEIFGSYDTAVKAMELYRILIQGSASSMPFTEMMEDRNLFASWHTHPNIGDSPEPSDLDIGGTYEWGPEVVFADASNRLVVYSINKGSVKEIYRSKKTLNVP